MHHGAAPGGAPESLRRLLTSIDPTRFRSRVLLPARRPLDNLFQTAGAEVAAGPIAPFYYLAHVPRVPLRNRIRHALLGPWEEQFVRHQIEAFRPDIVHLNAALLPRSARAARRAGARVLWHVREVIPDDDPAARDYLLNMARVTASRIVAISEAAARPFRAAGPVSVIHEGIDPVAWWRPDRRAAIRAGLGAGPDQFVTLFPGMLLPAKGQERFLDHLDGILGARPGRVVWLAGGVADPAYAERLRRKAAPWEECGRLRWLGWRSDLADVMAGADVVLALPEREEGFGLPLIEAMAAGRAVIAHDIGPAGEIVADGVTGWLIPPNDPDALPAALDRAESDPERRLRMGGAGRERVERLFRLDQMARAFERLFDEILAGPPGP